MRIANTPKSKRALIMSSAGIVILAAAAGSYFYLNGRDNQAQPANTQNTSPVVSNEPTQAQPNPKKSPDHTPTQYTPPASSSSSDQPASDQITGVVNYKSVNNGTLSIRLTIDQRISTGTCTLTLTNKESGKTLTKNVEVATNPSSSTCHGFDIPTSELSSGDWAISVKVVSGNSNGTIKGSVKI